MIDVATFKAAFPEFANAPDALVASQLAYAVTRVNSAVYGDLTEEGSFLWCAKFLAQSPFSRKMGLVREDGRTPYDDRLHEIVFTVASGYRVL